MLISPTEPSPLKALGIVSSIPEQMGVDYLFVTNNGPCGVQRKTVDDLVGSIRDGRLNKEVAQMSGSLTVAELMVEGRAIWTTDGVMVRYPSMTRAGWWNLLRSVQAGGVKVSFTENMEMTAAALRAFGAWCEKEVHQSLVTRPGPVGVWGKPSSREWCLHLLQGFGDGIGPGLAGAILTYFGGLPIAWTVNEAELMEVPGIGPKRARGLVRALERTQDSR